MVFSHCLNFRMVDVVLARVTIQYAVAELEGDRVLGGLHVLVHVRSLAPEENAVQTRIELRSRRAARQTETGQGLMETR